MNPNDLFALLNYALLHQCILREYYRAEKMYLKALAQDKTNKTSVNNCNLSMLPWWLLRWKRKSWSWSISKEMNYITTKLPVVYYYRVMDYDITCLPMIYNISHGISRFKGAWPQPARKGRCFYLFFMLGNGNDYATLLFATAPAQHRMPIFSRFPRILNLVLISNVDILFELAK